MRHKADQSAAPPLLLAVAAPAEARAVLAGLGGDTALAERPWVLHRVSDLYHVVVTGIGKANAAGAVGRVLEPAAHAGVVSIGVAGALPGGGAPDALDIGTVIAATASVYADEGLATDAGFTDCAAMGFPLGPAPIAGSSIAADPVLLARLRPLAATTGPVATVSTCSGTDALAAQVAARTGARAEAMEGSAVAQVAARLGVPAAELRVISNTTGQRSAQRWDLRLALGVLGEITARLAGRA